MTVSVSLVHVLTSPSSSGTIFPSALNHHTSKLTSFSSLTTLTSFGFRGEALSSLCALCESVVVTTATNTDGQKGVGTKLEMGRCGEVVKKSVVARQVGGSVLICRSYHPSKA
jgi:DNA mismatch repair protein PMS2